MALVDSEAAFEQRLREVMPSILARQAVLNGGVKTFSGLAFLWDATEPTQRQRFQRLFRHDPATRL